MGVLLSARAVPQPRARRFPTIRAVATGVEISVVIATCDRAESLTSVLEALAHQEHRTFEVVVVQGPCHDGTDAVLDGLERPVKRVRIQDRNLSKARNAGIVASAGELVAFLDDDAVPGSGWLRQLASAFAKPDVGGAGGHVYDRDGFGFQSRFAACTRWGEVSLEGQVAVEPSGDLFPYLQGTNQCYRRAVLQAAGGFDEGFRYLYDEVDLCLRLVDAGVILRQLNGAPVVHARLANGSRMPDGAFVDPEPPVEARALFALRHGGTRPESRAALDRYVEEVLAIGRMMQADGRLTSAGHASYEQAVQRGLDQGRELAGQGPRLGLPAEPAPEPLLPYVGERARGHLRVCFVSRDLPPSRGSDWPADAGGVARYSSDLADAFVDDGHEVHVITGTDQESSLAWEDGRWMHRLAANRREALAALRPSNPSLVDQLANAVSVWHEVRRTLEFGSVDVVSAPLYRCEGLICSLDERVPTMTTLHTSYRTTASMHPSWTGRPEIEASLALERATFPRARHVHALTEAALADARKEAPLRGSAAVLPLGVRDRGVASGGGGGILFVGRLERRKGVDVLLEAFSALHQTHPEARLTLAGQDSANTETGQTYRQSFESRAASDPALAAAVTFLGPVSDRRLEDLYRGCDFVCAPSRYESFGLVAVEAMSFGKPVVACRSGGTPEVVRDGVDGLLAAPGDAAMLAGCLGRLIDDPALRATLGANARSRFESTFDLPVAARRIALAYRELAAASVPSLPPARSEVEVEAEVAGVVAELGLGFGAEARELARRLLDPSRHPVDFPEAIRALADESEEHFVTRAYELLAGRSPSVATRTRHLAALAGGATRIDVVRDIATSAEAVRRGGPPEWLATLGPLPKSSPVHRVSRLAARRMLRVVLRLAQRSGAYAAAIQVLRAQARAAASEAMDDVRSSQRELSEEVERLQARLDRLARQDQPGETIESR